MEKKRAKEIAVKEWEAVIEYMKKDGYSPDEEDIRKVKSRVLMSLFREGFLTEEEYIFVTDNSSCALCTFFDPFCMGRTACIGCPLYFGGNGCEEAGQPYAFLAWSTTPLTVGQCIMAASEVLKLIESWNVEE